MNAIEIRGLTKVFGKKQALCGLDMTVPKGSIYGFIGENGSGKSTTEKIICGLIHASGGEVKLFGKSANDEQIRSKMSVLIESPGCFPSLSVWNNLMIQADNLALPNAGEAVIKVLKAVRMEGAANNKYKNCSLGMKQRVGIAMALLGNPELLVLDEPVNGLDADGMRILREILCEVAKSGATVVISSHVLGELQKVATHYGIIRGGKMMREMTAAELDADCPRFVAVRVKNEQAALVALSQFGKVQADENGYIRVYGGAKAEQVVQKLFETGMPVSEVFEDKISLEEYYDELMNGGVRNAAK